MLKTNEPTELVDRVVNDVSEIVSDMAGIQLGPRQASMVENRLRTRIVRLGLDGFKAYLDHLKNNKESESQVLLSLMTTHHTYFFREFSHFEFLLNKSLPVLIEKARKRQDKSIHIWSAACSRGQEVYSLSMFFGFHLGQMAPDVKYRIWGTDIDPESVKIAQNGVYKNEELKQSPAMYVNNNWIRGKGNVSEFSKIKDHLKQHCRFSPLNLLKPGKDLADKKFDVIFCRNVFIYFNHEQIKAVTSTFMNHLDSDGYIVLGVSETLNGMNLKLDLTGPSIYQFAKPKESRTLAGIVAPVSKMPPTVIKEILCVDDSPTILALLKKILLPEYGFRVTATAKNGQEALDILKSKKFDGITLDLHMPLIDGVGFLKQHDSKKTPVVVVSSINRDDPTIAKEALSLGAIDYVEKPSLDNLAQAGNEIRSKLKSAFQMISGASTNSNTSAPQVEAHASTQRTASVPKDFRQKIKVLVVDDSITIRNLLQQLLNRSPDFEVVGLAEKPSQVEDMIKKLKPNLITLDIHMPEMDGVALLKKIHPIYKIPTVMITSIQKEDGPMVLNALESGAVGYIQKPSAKDLMEQSGYILERLKIAAQANLKMNSRVKKMVRSVSGPLDRESLVLLGASTGGTEAIKTVLESLPKEIPPILIVQHIPPVFSAAFAQRLNQLVPFEVREAKDGDVVSPNLVLIAPGGAQMSVVKSGGQLVIKISDAPPVNRHKPSVDYLFQSANKLKIRKLVAVILTGMGADGAKQMKELRDLGARTIAQDEASSVVFGMPREAIRLNGAEFVLPLDQVAEKLVYICNQDEKTKKDVA